ncbi:MAG TPA: DUF2269 family protein [Candidatus Acidoferrales bacterium]|nr:DUF2269 family protein [Candidatus Acidoferrales bacterium]
MDLGPWLHFAHITAAVVWVGGGIVLSVIARRVHRSADVTVLAEFARTLSYVGLRVFTPAVLVVLATGVWLVFAEQSGNFAQLWVVLALAAFIVAFLVGAVYLSRSAIRLERVMSEAKPDIGAGRAALAQWIFGYGVVLAVLVFALWDMVFKPGS